MARTLVAVGISNDAAMFVTIRAAAPRSGVTVGPAGSSGAMPRIVVGCAGASGPGVDVAGDPAVVVPSAVEPGAEAALTGGVEGTGRAGDVPDGAAGGAACTVGDMARVVAGGGAEGRREDGSVTVVVGR